MSEIRISSDQLSAEIQNVLTLYSEKVAKKVKKTAKSSMDQLVRDTKATAPVGRRSSHYRDSIKSRKESETTYGATYRWYVDGSNYRLSHLLEFGHQTRNGGRSTAYHFIQNAADPIIEAYEKAVEEAIRNG